jgi:serine phosphatase RsbU (regulator of sigma subunit)
MHYSGFNRLATRPRGAAGASASPARKPEAGSGYRQLELKVAALQKDYAELHSELVEAAQVHRRLCAPRLVKCGNFEIASETFAVRHVPGDFFAIEQTSKGVVLALSDICGKGLAAGMWTTYLAGLVVSHTAANDEPRVIAGGVTRDLCRMSPVAQLASLFLAKLDPDSGNLEFRRCGAVFSVGRRAGLRCSKTVNR